jgi:hypothetical protein
VTGDRACLSYAPDVGHPPASPADAWRCCLAAPARHAQAAPRWTRGRAAAEPGQGPGGRGEKGGEGVAAGHERRKGGRGSRSVWEMPHDLRQRRRKQRGRDCGMHPSGVKRCRPSQHALLPLCTSLPPPHTSGTTSAVGSECPPPPSPPLTHPPHTHNPAITPVVPWLLLAAARLPRWWRAGRAGCSSCCCCRGGPPPRPTLGGAGWGRPLHSSAFPPARLRSRS